MKIPRFMIFSLFVAFPAVAAAGDKVPALLRVGEHMCKVSKEYKLRKCRVAQDGKDTILSLYDPGHLLQLEGVVYPGDYKSRGKRLFVEAKIRGDRPGLPYVCTVDDPKAAQECANQTVMVELKRVSKTKWKGEFALKHYWDAYVGEGDARHKEGIDITVEFLTVELRLGNS